MRLNIILLVAAALFTQHTLFAQGAQYQDQDPKAKKILDKVSENTKKHSSIRAEFESLMENKQDGIEINQEGSVTIRGNKYILELGEQKVISDGKLSWTFFTADNEVHINDIDDADDVIKPEEFFTIWEQDFKYQYHGDATLEGVNVAVIKLHPMEPRDKPYHTVELYVDKAKNQIHQIKVVGKDGTDYTYNIKSFGPETVLSDADFTFQKSKYPGIDVIDMRD